MRAKSYDAPADDWANIVSSVLETQTQPSVTSQQSDNLDVTCSISGKEGKRSLSITFSNKVEEITQRLGTIELSETEDTDDVDLFGWAALSIEQKDGLHNEVTDLKGQVKAKDDIVSSLQEQIDELVEAKADHEKQMLSKFALLLNEKKLKIRNMQRILSTAKADPKKINELQAMIGNEPASVARRKRPADEEAAEDQDDESDDFEAVDADAVTEAQKEPGSPSDASTPTASEADNETDEEDLSGPAANSNQPRERVAESQHKQPKGEPQSGALAKEKLPASNTIGEDEETASEDEEDEL